MKPLMTPRMFSYMRFYTFFLFNLEIHSNVGNLFGNTWWIRFFWFSGARLHASVTQNNDKTRIKENHAVYDL